MEALWKSIDGSPDWLVFSVAILVAALFIGTEAALKYRARRKSPSTIRLAPEQKAASMAGGSYPGKIEQKSNPDRAPKATP